MNEQVIGRYLSSRREKSRSGFFWEQLAIHRVMKLRGKFNSFFLPACWAELGRLKGRPFYFS
jgi:hypothetical protein